ncbi:helix-turn-helix domain-containing protein [Streptomyces sp. NPDC005799]|uniref:helix-turn-helix domain-containing protein n=1 Tax=Streptomyces sp. NPDC005799 TaxID=3154678 RepID=UPI0033CF09EF
MADCQKGYRLTGEARAKVAAELKPRYEAGATIKQLAEETGRSTAGVADLLRAAGTEMRPGTRRTHGYTGTSLYRSWADMVDRCTRPTHKRWADYGGRGITVCERWRKFENFLADVGDRPPGMTIDRVDNDRGYEPDNFRWANTSTQNRNRRYYERGPRDPFTGRYTPKGEVR